MFAKFCYAAEPHLHIQTSSGEVAFSIEIANTPETRRLGLMHRTSLKPSAAMLFEYPEPRKVSMWMKNTSIPLDILFIDRLGIIIKIHEYAEPFSLHSISSEQAVIAVLEVNAGVTKKFNIKTGDLVDYKLFERDKSQ